VTAGMLRSLLPMMEKHHNVSIREEAITATVHLSDRYLHGRRQPDNEEMLIAVVPHPLSPGSTALPSSKGFRVEMTGTEEGRQNGLMIR
ncbi:hypothetical protein OFN52_32615, partial [Escherichia coli]|nr:hypothetical protein [Escherichia coli]